MRLLRLALPLIALAGLSVIGAAAPAAAADSNAEYVDAVYQDLLGRPADQGGLTYFAGQLDAGASRTSFVGALLGSTEFATLMVDIFYNDYLGRDADSGGRAYFSAYLDAGGAHLVVEATLAGSAEYYAAAGGTDDLFLNRLYTDVLFRPVDNAGRSYWKGRLTAGTSRADVAGSLLTSGETVALRTEASYQLFLRRGSDAQGFNAFSSQLAATGEWPLQWAAMLVSDEYYGASPYPLTSSEPGGVSSLLS